ncbi:MULTISPECIES: bifunctional riboflavin kinase/FAD synthetase [unclassified Iodidimonas]|uniref:bifunctional riboflavin kinase/FAD synthetase n=1 Tax=unclassified Iodidimonas TaxID=2626145 RepID=UPI0024828D49|nr:MULTISPECIES: bifunctional riboflavin kinase/FAD synthetase [unclassified Iodidimonas]
MDLISQPGSLPDDLRGSVAALGNFDGFHCGHQVVVGEAGRLARAMNLPLTVITTEPHPRSFFRPQDPPFRLTPHKDRAWLLQQFGVDLLVSLPFDQALSRLLPQEFVETILCAELGVMHLVAGYDYRFGAKRAGGTDLLAYMGQMEGFGLSVVEPVRFPAFDNAEDGSPEGGVVYSSSLVRETLKAGNPRLAARMLGHWWSISGTVEEGDRRGRTIGFPTANLRLKDIMEPAFGVYAVRVELVKTGQVHEGVANLGRRPTFAKTDVMLEVYLFDFEGDLYGCELRVDMVDFIRPEQKFSGLDALKAQIAMDCDRARLILADPAHDRRHHRPPRLESYLAQNPTPLARLR